MYQQCSEGTNFVRSRGTNVAMANENVAARSVPLFLYRSALLWLRKPQKNRRGQTKSQAAYFTTLVKYSYLVITTLLMYGRGILQAVLRIDYSGRCNILVLLYSFTHNHCFESIPH